MNDLGDLFIKTGNPAEARAHYTQAVRIDQDLPAPPGEARALEGIGRSYLDESPAEAFRNLQQALEIYQRLGSAAADKVREVLAELPPAGLPDRLHNA